MIFVFDSLIYFLYPFETSLFSLQSPSFSLENGEPSILALCLAWPPRSGLVQMKLFSGFLYNK